MVQIPAQHINSVGGALVITPFGGAIGGLGNNTPEWNINAAFPLPASGAPSWWIDCADWQLTRQPIFDDVTDTGSYGAVNRDQTAEDWSLQANIIVDQRFPPDMIIRYGYPYNGVGLTKNVPTSLIGLGFNLGVRIALIQGCGVNYPVDAYLDFFWCPSAKLAQNGPIIDANNKKEVRMPIAGVGNARIFKMPAEYNNWLDYATHLSNRGQVF